MMISTNNGHQKVKKKQSFTALFSLLFPILLLLISNPGGAGKAEYKIGPNKSPIPARGSQALDHGHDHGSILDGFGSWEAPATAPMANETLPAGTLIIAMDNALQDNSTTRVRRAYGLAVHLLHADIPLKWIINPNKTSRTAVDFSASARLRYPSTSGYSSRSFRTGPLAIFPGYEAEAQSVINSYGNGIRVYELQSATTVPVHSDLTHKPKVLVEQQENPDIHTSILSAAGLRGGTHYNRGPLVNVDANSCVTIITVPHNKRINSAQRNKVKDFVRNGGNFLAQCAAVRSFQANNPRAFTNAGFRDEPGLGNFAYDNPTEPSAQFEGNIADEGGSLEDFGFNTQPPGGTRIVHGTGGQANNYKAYTGPIDGFTADAGGYVHYLGGHNHDGNINADRFYLNAVLRSADRPMGCGLTIELVNANDDTGTIDCDNGSVTINVLANDDNPQGNPLAVSLLGSGNNGTFVNNNDGTVTYTGNVNGFWGGDQITYEACDGTTCDQATITITSPNPNQLTINGTVFEDNNMNAVLDAGESGPAGVTVNLYQDLNSNGVRDGGEPLVQSTTTATGGGYSLITSTAVTPPVRFVIEVAPATLPANPTFTTDNVEVANFTAPGQLDCNNHFGYVSCPTPPNAGSDGSTTVCEGVVTSPLNFFDIITGEDAGGTWTETTAGASSGVSIGDGTTVDFTTVALGTYEFTYTLTATNCPPDTSIATITVPAAVIVALDSKTDASCNSIADGSISITASGGTPGYTYLWSDGATSEDRTGLPAGTYTVTVTDVNGCIGTLTETITEISDITLTSTQVNPSCAGDNNGSIEVTVSGGGGTAPYNVSWSGPSSGNPAGDEIATSGGSYNITGLSAGIYTVTVTDALGCTATLSRTLTAPAALAATATATDYDCFGQTGAVSLAVVGGTTPRTFSWTGPSGFTATTQNISGLTEGTYTVTVTDANNCTTTAMATVTGPANAVAVALDSKTGVSCDGDTDGTISITASGGTPGYTYLWSDGATAEDRTALAPGVYTITVTDANGCTGTLTETITEPDPLLLTISKMDPTCPPGAEPPFNSDGTIDLTVAGGTAPYTYAWTTNDGAGLDPTAEDQTGLTAGTYAVTVTDANGCTGTVSVTLENENQTPVTPVGINNN